ncbi:MAG: L-2-amino-thiazoline-4-carboxylic acid hydrolase [Clostridia bacterium]|nr:L-2-amino-thiazoline-4-carboxylic acid hydrolase [Clostridia bacterium]
MNKNLSKEFIDDLNNSPKKFHESTNPKATREMKEFKGALSVTYYWLKQEIGAWQALMVLLKSFTWDLIFNKPTWQPEKFPIESSEDEKIWLAAFNKDIVWLYMINENLRRKYGKDNGDDIMVRFIMPVGLFYQWFCFRPIDNHTHIDQLRQQMADYLGDGKTMRNRVWVSEDSKEAKYYYTRCMHIQLMVGYGMNKAAQGSCMIDHVTFDKRIPTLKFKRTKSMCLGDSYCDHYFSVREEGGYGKPYEYYEDAHRADFDAYGEIQKLEEKFDRYGPKLRK